MQTATEFLAQNARLGNKFLRLLSLLQCKFSHDKFESILNKYVKHMFTVTVIPLRNSISLKHLILVHDFVWSHVIINCHAQRLEEIS